MKPLNKKALGLFAGAMVVQALVGTVPYLPNPFKKYPEYYGRNPEFTKELQEKPTLSLVDLWRLNYAPKGKTVTAGLSPDQMFLAFAGMREMIASILWVRADAFFEQGNYDAILPIIRIVTWLDPKQVDVYSTGMWHIGYNFTDEESRSDRRYIPSALALGKEGAHSNQESYELFFETGWMWFHKVNDYHENAVKWMELAETKPDMLVARKNILGMAYQRAGMPEKGLEHYMKLLKDADAKYRKSGEFADLQNRDTLENNVDTTLVRMSQRGWFAKGDKSSTPIPFDTQPPFDVGFSAQVTIPKPRVLRIKATWNVRPVGTRIRVVLRDADMPNALPAAMKWDAGDDVNLDPPKDLTFMQDELFVRNRRVDKRIDMQADPTMYPFTKDKYVLEFFYSPRVAPPHIQDRFSWSGEGMTDANFLSTDARTDQRVMYCRLELTKDMIDRMNGWYDKEPVLQTKNYKEISTTRSGEEEIINVPGLRN